ncbi:DUF1402 family protein [Rhodobacteraceae bacterium RKSG542]|uniref:DUF1402 family protein n=1 Tax=Pseudovibrio flavus TaxID=2529854 RepID=UPI0012BD0CF0|nr:DUF1402 family protein [Pseudovibrio flavus]MTI19052.1 DUF1402 family protein [Pseudovibrio flavus]
MAISGFHFGLSIARKLLSSVLLSSAVCLTAPAMALEVMPTGNRNMEQPPIPEASRVRTSSFQRTYEKKFQKILRVLKRDRTLLNRIRVASERYGFDPIHLVAAIVGEHTYNYDSLDSAQSYYLKAIQYSGIRLEFELDDEHVSKFVTRPQFDTCNQFEQSSRKWRCYEQVWREEFMGKVVDGKQFPLLPFNRTFFYPMFAGQSFGIGQLTPLTALKMSDRVETISGFSPLSPDNAMEIYKRVMDPATSIDYSAAVIADAIEAYKTVAGIDISTNPGITATLYNLGNPWERAEVLRKKREKEPEVLPSENYYGWLANERLEELRAVLK